ncbi:carbon-nitrogen hydrolase family protein [Actinomadura sp. B10D3]|uniref:carbon-nitrogen hydrolase family protein n=1 Tax=Actinomadura sp. B10D3 TaxID=3153557 RepID=UPI00325F67DB
MSIDETPAFTVAAVHAAPVFMDRDATIDKMGGLVARASRSGADLAVFPESFIPGFPLWTLVHAPIDQHAMFRRLYQQAMPVPGPEATRIAALARRHGLHVSVGITERSPVSMGGLYNTNLLFDPDGRLVHIHRKLVPTWAEKLVWARGDGSSLRPTTTSIGRLGVLICGENTNPLARYALLAQGEQLHISTYPPAWPFRRGASPDTYQRWIELRAAAHSFEGKVFNVVAAAHLDEAAIVQSAAGDPRAEETLRGAGRAASMIIGPGGVVVAGPHPGEEDLVVAPVDVADSIEEKLAHDVVGYYQRPDLLQLRVDQRPQPPVSLLNEVGSGSAPWETPGADPTASDAFSAGVPLAGMWAADGPQGFAAPGEGRVGDGGRGKVTDQ